MPGHDIIVIGASAGGVEALKHLVGRLPASLPSAIFIVVHIPSTSISLLPDLINRWGLLPASAAVDGDLIQSGHIYIAPPDFHMLLESGRVRLLRGPRENHTRPAIDPLFRTAARAYGNRVVGVILSGMLNDGTAGLIEVKRHGGLAIAQSPDEALFGDMPRSAINNVAMDYVLPLSQIAAMLTDLARETHARKGTPDMSASQPVQDSTAPPPSSAEMPSMPPETPQQRVEEEDAQAARLAERDAQQMHDERGNQIIMRDGDAQIHNKRNDTTSIYSCPDCGGVLWQMNDEGFIRFRCHVGHAFTAEALLQQQAEALEASMWYAVRTLIDKAKLSLQMADRANERGNSHAAAHFEAQSQAASQHAGVIRNLIESGATSRTLERVES